MDGYETLFCNYKSGKEGLLIAVKEGTFTFAEKIYESEEKNILSVKVEYPNCSLRFILAHGPQETDNVDTRNQFFESLMVEVERGKASDDNVLLLGDMNAKIQSNQSNTGDDVEDVSNNGTLLKELVEKYELDVLNFHPSATGKWTRIRKKKKTTERSVIDYIMVEENLKSRIEDVVIDEDKLYTPWRLVYSKKQRHIIFSDHTAMITTININRGVVSAEPSDQPTGWRLTAEGMAKYKELTSERDAVVINKHGGSTQLYQNWMDQAEAIVTQCFPKRKPAKKRTPLIHKGAAFIRKTLSEISSKGKIQRQLTKDYMQRLIQKEVETVDMDIVTPEMKRILELAQEKGAGAWLTTTPIQSLGFALNKQQFRDSMCLRYGWRVPHTPNYCSCGGENSIDHALSCRRGGYTIMRHNKVRDLEAELMREVCNDVRVEPELLPLNNEQTVNGNVAQRLDVSGNGVWGPQERTFLDVRIMHPNAPSYREKDIQQVYRQHEQEKKRTYNERIIQVEKGSFTPIVLSTFGGMGLEAERFHKRIAQLIAAKRKDDYPSVINYIRTRLRFCLLKSVLVSLRGVRGKSSAEKISPISTLSFNMIDFDE